MMIFENLLGLFSFLELECNLNACVKDNNIQNNHVPKLQYNKKWYEIISHAGLASMWWIAATWKEKRLCARTHA